MVKLAHWFSVCARGAGESASTLSFFDAGALSKSSAFLFITAINFLRSAPYLTHLRAFECRMLVAHSVPSPMICTR